MQHSTSVFLMAPLCALLLLAGPAQAQPEGARFAPSELTSLPEDQLKTNAMRRCESLPPFYKVDCEARVNGQGQVSGSVAGGGLLKESTTTVPAAEMERPRGGWQPPTGQPGAGMPMQHPMMEHRRDHRPMMDHRAPKHPRAQHHRRGKHMSGPPAAMPPAGPASGAR